MPCTRKGREGEGEGLEGHLDGWRTCQSFIENGLWGERAGGGGRPERKKRMSRSVELREPEFVILISSLSERPSLLSSLCSRI